MTKGRLAASSQARLVADEAKHPIRKIQPQLITCNPPDQVQSSRWDGSHRQRKHASTMTDDASARHGQPPPSARQRRRRLPHRLLAADASPDVAWVQTPTNTLCSIAHLPRRSHRRLPGQARRLPYTPIPGRAPRKHRHPRTLTENACLSCRIPSKRTCWCAYRFVLKEGRLCCLGSAGYY